MRRGLILVLALLAGCTAGPAPSVAPTRLADQSVVDLDPDRLGVPTGIVQVRIDWPRRPQTLPATTTKIRLSVTAADLPTPVVAEIVAPVATADLAVKAGTGRALTAEGLNAAGTVVARATQTGLTINPDTYEAAHLTLAPLVTSISGSLVDDETGLPETGVLVYLDGQGVDTDSTGAFSLVDTAIGTHSVTLTKWDRVVATTSWEFEAASGSVSLRSKVHEPTTPGPAGTVAHYAAGTAPVDLAIDSGGNVWVTNPGLGALVKLTNAGAIATTVNTVATPERLAIDASDNVWMTSKTNTMLKRYTSAGAASGSYAAGDHLTAIAIAPSGMAWVSIADQSKLWRIKATLSPDNLYNIASSSVQLRADSSSGVWVAIDAGTTTLQHLNAAGASLGSWQVAYTATGMAVDSHGNVWLNGPTSVAKLSPAGVLLTSYDFGEPTGDLAVDPDGNPWVLLPTTRRVAHLSVSTLVWTPYAVQNNPQHLSLDPAGNCWVTNKDSNTVSKLTP